MAVTEREVQGPVDISRSRKDGKSGYLVRYSIYTIKSSDEIAREQKEAADEAAADKAAADKAAADEAAAEKAAADKAAAERAAAEKAAADKAAADKVAADKAAAEEAERLRIATLPTPGPVSVPDATPQPGPRYAPTPGPAYGGAPEYGAAPTPGPWYGATPAPITPYAPTSPPAYGSSPNSSDIPTPNPADKAAAKKAARDAELAELITWNGHPITDERYPWEYSHTIDFGALDRVLKNPSYFGPIKEDVRLDKRPEIEESISTTKKGGFKTSVLPNASSAFLEASRLARILELLDQGASAPEEVLSVYYMAFWQDQSFKILFTRQAILASLQMVFRMGINTLSPIVLDLNHDGKIGVTGLSTAAMRHAKNNAFVRQGSVHFDLDGFGKKSRFEWLNGDGDGFLVHDADGIITRAAKNGSDISGKQLFGNAIGYDHGFQKLSLYTGGVAVAVDKIDRLPVGIFDRSAARGSELAKLKVWVDHNHDAMPQPSELLTLNSLGITEIGLLPKFERNAVGEVVIRSYFVQHGQRYMTEDVWFAQEPGRGNAASGRR